MRPPLVTLALAYMVFSVLYLGGAALSLTPPATLTPSVLDAAIPFLPWTVWAYLLQFPYLGFVYWRARDTVAWARDLRGMLAATVASVAVFVLYPTGIPREAVDADPATTLAFAVLYGTDPATNCLPSLHVSLAFLGAAGFWPERPRLAGACLAWAALITVSTLTTKQHYVVDVLAGLAVALAAGWLARLLEASGLRARAST